MILQSLAKYYEILAADPDIPIARFGYSTTGVSFALNLSDEGELLDILPQFRQEQRGKQTVEVSRPMIVPEAVKRSGTRPNPNFLWDNATYVLGISNQDEVKPDYARERFDAFRALHVRMLTGVNSPKSMALLAFLARYDPATAREQQEIAKYLDALLQGGNLVFMHNGEFLHHDRAILRAWDSMREERGGAQMQCLVSGDFTTIARLHPSLKRVKGAQPSGATLVGFNAPAYESYNRTQGFNSPVGEPAAFAYTTVLNYLLSNDNPHKKFFMGDATVVYWAESQNRAYEDAYGAIMEPTMVEVQEQDNTARNQAEGKLAKVAQKVRRIQALDIDELLKPLQDDDPTFYVLGLAPNSARVSVRFFVAEPFSEVVDNIMAHYRDMEIVKEFDNQPKYITIDHILSETVSKKAQSKDASPLLSGALVRAILMHQPYPAALYYAILNRVRVDADDSQLRVQKVNYVRAATIKAYLTRKYRSQPNNPVKEVLSVSLNRESKNTAYLLGRLFAVLEKAQRDALGNDINATIKDRYFAAACGSPGSVFPTLLRLLNHWVSKSGKYYADMEIQNILNLLEVDQNPFPARLSLDEQGIFVLGYYHERSYLYTKSDKSAASDTSLEDAPQMSFDEL